MNEPADYPIEWCDGPDTAKEYNDWQQETVTVREGFVFQGFRPSKPERRRRRRRRRGKVGE